MKLAIVGRCDTFDDGIAIFVDYSMGFGMEKQQDILFNCSSVYIVDQHLSFSDESMKIVKFNRTENFAKHE